MLNIIILIKTSTAKDLRLNFSFEKIQNFIKGYFG